MWNCVPQLTREVQVRSFFLRAAIHSLELFPLQEANKAAIHTILRKTNAESGAQGRVSPRLSFPPYLPGFLLIKPGQLLVLVEVVDVVSSYT